MHGEPYAPRRDTSDPPLDPQAATPAGPSGDVRSFGSYVDDYVRAHAALDRSVEQSGDVAEFWESIGGAR